MPGSALNSSCSSVLWIRNDDKPKKFSNFEKASHSSKTFSNSVKSLEKKEIVNCRSFILGSTFFNRVELSMLIFLSSQFLSFCLCRFL